MVLFGKPHAGLVVLSAWASAVSVADVPDVSVPMPIVAPLLKPASDKWSHEGIAKLTQSAAKLLHTTPDGNLVTPAIATFTNKTIEEIDEVIDQIENASKLARQELTKWDQKFVNEAQKLNDSKVKVTAQFHGTSLSNKRAAHTDCRDKEASLVQTEKECRVDETDLNTLYNDAENNLNTTYTTIKTRWCSPDDECLDDEECFFEKNEQDMESYIGQKATAKKAEEDYTAKKDQCDKIEANKNSQREQCNHNQTQLELEACSHAQSVQTENEKIHTTWNELVKEYQMATTDVADNAEDRKKEFAGLVIVRCLLDMIQQNQLAGTPCDEIHAEKVNNQIRNCHSLDVNVSHLAITIEDAPDSPSNLTKPEHPCTDEFFQENYGKFNWIAEVLTIVTEKCRANPCDGL